MTNARILALVCWLRPIIAFGFPCYFLLLRVCLRQELSLQKTLMLCSRVSSSARLVFDCLSQISESERSSPLVTQPQRISAISSSTLLVICQLPIANSAIVHLEITFPPTSATFAHLVTLVLLANSLCSKHSVCCAPISIAVLFDFLRPSMSLYH